MEVAGKAAVFSIHKSPNNLRVIKRKTILVTTLDLQNKQNPATIIESRKMCSLGRYSQREGAVNFLSFLDDVQMEILSFRP